MGKIVAQQNERSLSRMVAQSRRALSTVNGDCCFNFITDVGNYARKYFSVVILTDFDAEGKLSNEIIGKLLDIRGVESM
jgi:5S rRNA maturation endonuclease (ribonuclease M5)